MWWLVAIALLAGTIFVPALRKVVLVLCGLVVVVLAYVNVSADREAKASRQRIPLGQVGLDGLVLGGDVFPSVRGRVFNNSTKYTLEDFTLEVTIEDCIGDTNCVVVYQDDVSPLIVSVPPGQARDFEITGVGDTDTRFRGHMRWRYRLVETRGGK